MFQFITDGYNSSNTEEIPAIPNMFQEKIKQLRLKFHKLTKDHKDLKYLLEDFDHILEVRKNAAAVLIVIGAIIGFIFATILNLLGGMRRAKKASKKKSD